VSGDAVQREVTIIRVVLEPPEQHVEDLPLREASRNDRQLQYPLLIIAIVWVTEPGFRHRRLALRPRQTTRLLQTPKYWLWQSKVRRHRPKERIRHEVNQSAFCFSC